MGPVHSQRDTSEPPTTTSGHPSALTSLTRNEAPIVEAVYATNWSLTKRRPRQVLPTPDAPRMTSFASCFDDIGGAGAVSARVWRVVGSRAGGCSEKFAPGGNGVTQRACSSGVACRQQMWCKLTKTARAWVVDPATASLRRPLARG